MIPQFTEIHFEHACIWPPNSHSPSDC